MDSRKNNSLRFADETNNISSIPARARYYMWVIANDWGFNQTQFENKYREENYTVEVEAIIKKEGELDSINHGHGGDMFSV